MNKGYYKFYASKLKIIRLIIISIFIVIISLFFTDTDQDILLNPEASPRGLVGPLCACVFFILAVCEFFSLFSNKPYIEITPLFIKVTRYQALNLPWRDIMNIKKEIYWHRMILLHELYFDLKKSSKNKATIENPYVELNPLSSKDQQKLISILKRRFPKSKLD